MCAKYMELYARNDKAMNMQCMKQTSFNAWSCNLNHIKIMQQCMTTLVNAPKLVHLYPFKLPKLKSILWYFLFTKNDIDEVNKFFLCMYDKLGVELVWNTYINTCIWVHEDSQIFSCMLYNHIDWMCLVV